MSKRIKAKIRANLMRKVNEVDFSTMSREAYDKWINDLPPSEFVSLLDLHAELKSAQARPAPVEQVNPLDDAWIAIDKPETYGIPPETIVYVLYRDGEIGGPNRIDAFLWGDPSGPLAFAPARVLS